MLMPTDYPIAPAPKRDVLLGHHRAASANAMGNGATLVRSPRRPLERLMHMSKRNLGWLAVIVVISAVLWIAFGWLWGVGGGIALLVLSEFVERSRRKQRRAARGDTSKHSVLGVVKRERPSR